MKTKLIFSQMLLFTVISIQAQQWGGSGSTSGLIYRNGNVTIGNPYDKAKFNIEGTRYYTHFFHGKNEDVYLRPGTNQGMVYFDIGNVKFSNHAEWSFYKRFGFGTRAEGYNRLLFTHTGTHGYIDYKDNLHFRADKNWISALTLYGNGSVGVGFQTTMEAGHYKNQGYKLAVNGGVLCEEVKVVADVPDADYVFEEDYKLSTLEDVESFIIENKHLPNIPSAEQFKTNGYKVGEMDEMLLRKVEELTLYVIEQNKKIEELQSIINSTK